MPGCRAEVHEEAVVMLGTDETKIPRFQTILSLSSHRLVPACRLWDHTVATRSGKR